ncbi:transcriptional regulator, GntR family [Variovorax sp. PDC80]|uniref:GntR family transcriptional regulator n=1 Tax=Variovorax sp. PDC80 TaxID=1882827 RepID=UPI0008EC96B7|nr:GntR family transcriptional regulator [Variovorax sp. PDC80]SFP98001.1 transcriptional regulator, GntR family [Variovorax sp. PDC80]
MPAQLVSIEVAPDLVDQVYRALLGAISSGELAPGERLTQEDIAQRLSVSRQPVLQALRLLKKDGFVHDAPGRGVLVAPLDADWMRKVYQVRGALDVLAARLAAAERFRIDPKLMERGRRAARGRNVEAMIDADMAFHQAIYAASGNPLIAQSADQHWRHLRRAMGAVLQAEPQRESLWDEHEAIAATIAAGDAEQAARLSEEHVAQASEALGRRLAAQLARAASPASAPSSPSHPRTTQGDTA